MPKDSENNEDIPNHRIRIYPETARYIFGECIKKATPELYKKVITNKKDKDDKKDKEEPWAGPLRAALKKNMPEGYRFSTVDAEYDKYLRDRLNKILDLIGAGVLNRKLGFYSDSFYPLLKYIGLHDKTDQELDNLFGPKLRGSKKVAGPVTIDIIPLLPLTPQPVKVPVAYTSAPFKFFDFSCIVNEGYLLFDDASNCLYQGNDALDIIIKSNSVKSADTCLMPRDRKVRWMRIDYDDENAKSATIYFAEIKDNIPALIFEAPETLLSKFKAMVNNYQSSNLPVVQSKT